MKASDLLSRMPDQIDHPLAIAADRAVFDFDIEQMHHRAPPVSAF